MAQFTRPVITQAGQTLMTRVLADETTINFTRITTSSASYTPGQLETLTSLADIKQEILVAGTTVIDGTQVKITGAMNNRDLAVGYQHSTTGFWAQDGSGNEILYGVSIVDLSIADNKPMFIPPFSGGSTGLIFNVLLQIGNAEQVILEPSPAALATARQVYDINNRLVVITNDIQELRDEIENLVSFVIKGPFATVRDIPTPYQANTMYLVGTASPYEMFMYISETLRQIGASDVDLSWVAPINNPAFIGAPTAPTPGNDDNSTRVATTAFAMPRTWHGAANGVALLDGTSRVPVAQMPTSGIANRVLRVGAINSNPVWGQVQASDIASGAVITGTIADNAVTAAKIRNIAHLNEATSMFGGAIAIGNQASVANTSLTAADPVTGIMRHNANLVIGNHARTTWGTKNLAIGLSAQIAGHGSSNIAIGENARMHHNAATSADANIIIGHNARMDFGIQNVFIGSNAQTTSINTSNNVVIGNQANAAFGGANVVVGSQAQVLPPDELFFHLNSYGVAIGNSARLQGADVSIAIGDNARVLQGGGSLHVAGGIAIGSNSLVEATNSLGSMAVGRNVQCTHRGSAILSPNNGILTRATTTNNQILLGGWNEIIPMAHNHLTIVSDQRDKTEITDLKYDALAFVNRLQPKQYKSNPRSNYTQYEEISDAEYKKLDRYGQLHRVREVQVYGIEGTNIEWMEDDIVLNCNKFLTCSESKLVKNRAVALLEFEKNYLQQVQVKTDEEIEISSVEKLIKEVRKARFLRVFTEPDGTKAGKRCHNGFLAQQVERAAKDMGFDFAGVKYFAHNKDEEGVPEGDDLYALQYEQLIAPIVGAIQQLSIKNDALEKRNENLEQQNNKLEQRLLNLEMSYSQKN